MSNIILKRIYYAIDVELASPLNTSSGISEYTDKDILMSSTGEFFVPGTSIAGALRARLEKSDKERITGYSDSEKGKMSSLYISDLYFNTGGVKSVRDGVKLADEKTVENKFDMEVLETGSCGTIYLNYVLREKDDDREDIIKTLMADIQDGYIRFGANKNRGYGKMSVKKIYRQEFSRDNIDDFLEFDAKNTEKYEKCSDYTSWLEDGVNQSNDYVKINIPLVLTGGISIRKYSARPNEADFEQITISIKDENGNPKPVVPGTSWSGAIRSNILSTLKELGDSDAQKHVDQWFGFVDLEKKDAKQSIIAIGESIIENSRPLTMTRNKINRFDASTTDGALYTEKSYFGGETTLSIMIKKDEGCHYEALIGVLQIVIKDIQNGYIAIGGQTAVGRGIFKADNKKSVEYENAINEKVYSEALYTFLMGDR